MSAIEKLRELEDVALHWLRVSEGESPSAVPALFIAGRGYLLDLTQALPALLELAELAKATCLSAVDGNLRCEDSMQWISTRDAALAKLEAADE